MRKITELDKVFSQHAYEYQEREFRLMNQGFFLNMTDIQACGTLRSWFNAMSKNNNGPQRYIASQADPELDNAFDLAVHEIVQMWDRKRKIVLFATGSKHGGDLETAVQTLAKRLHPHTHLPPTQFIGVYSEKDNMADRIRTQLSLQHLPTDRHEAVLSEVIEVFNKAAYPTHTLNLSVLAVGATKDGLRYLFVLLEDLLMAAAAKLEMIPGIVTVQIQSITSTYADVVEDNATQRSLEVHLTDVNRTSVI